MEGDAGSGQRHTARTISIHALRVEGDDPDDVLHFVLNPDFYPRPPGGGRPLPLPVAMRAILFLSTPSGWRATSFRSTRISRCLFLSTPSGWRATHATAAAASSGRYFYPRPPGGGRPYNGGYAFAARRYFYPRPPGGGRLITNVAGNRRAEISIHALRVEGDSSAPRPGPTNSRISIHALRVEGDWLVRIAQYFRFDFYPRPPGGGRPFRACSSSGTPFLFLSTPSGWRATAVSGVRGSRAAYFYPRPPGGGRPSLQKKERLITDISIHALRVEGDGLNGYKKQSDNKISIHALRVEGDSSFPSTRTLRCLFLSTPSGWRATRIFVCAAVTGAFLSTPSGWRATGMLYLLYSHKPKFLSTPSGWRATSFSPNKITIVTKFLSTPSGWRATLSYLPSPDGSRDFYPRPPGGGRRKQTAHDEKLVHISIHALRVEGDLVQSDNLNASIDFYPRPPGGGRRKFAGFAKVLSRFLSTPSGWRATLYGYSRESAEAFLSTPSGWRATMTYISLKHKFSTFLSTPSGWRATQACGVPQ